MGLAISNDENYLYVTDTYNHKIKRVDLSKNSICTLKIANTPTEKDKKSLFSFNEPAGACVRDDKTILVADTNNHSVKILEIDADSNIRNVKTLELKLDTTDGVTIDKSKYQIIPIAPIGFNEKGGKLILQIKLTFLKGLKISEGAPQKWFVHLPNASWSCVPTSGSSVDNIDLVLSIPKVLSSENVDIVFNLITCTTESCYPKSFIVRQPIETSPGGVTSSTTLINVDLQVDKVELSKL